MLKTTVYISDINNLSDARYCAGMMVDYLGFNIDRIGVDNFKEITQWVEGKVIAEFDDANIDKINTIIETFNLDVIALHSDEIANGINAKVILFSDIENTNCELQIVNSDTDVSNFETPVLISGNINPQNFEEILNQKKVKGICLKGGNEIRPGYKDFDELADILELLED